MSDQGLPGTSLQRAVDLTGARLGCGRQNEALELSFDAQEAHGEA